MIKYVFLDLDDTLLDFAKSERRAIRATLSKLGILPTKNVVERYHYINAAQWKLLERGEITREQVLYRRFSLLFAEYGIACDPDMAQHVYEKELGARHYFIRSAKHALKQLSKNYSLYLVTNGLLTVQTSRLKRAKIAPFFQEIFISQNVGYDKPQPEYFEHCFAAIDGFEKKQAIIVGDSLSSDIKGGNNAGIRTCWFNPHQQKSIPDDICVDYQIDRLSKLSDLLKQL